MSLAYESIRSRVVPGVNVTPQDRQDVIDYIRHTDMLSSDVDQFTQYDLLDILFQKIRKATISIGRSERLGLHIDVKYKVVPNVDIALSFDMKKHKHIGLALLDADNIEHQEHSEPSVILQKLLLDRLPIDIRNVLMYYIYPPDLHDHGEIEKYEGPVVYDDSDEQPKIRTNYPKKWHMNNKWDVVSNLVFSVIEAVHNEKYKGLPYPITLDLNVCKEMCRQNEESIIVKKTFTRGN